MIRLILAGFLFFFSLALWGNSHYHFSLPFSPKSNSFDQKNKEVVQSSEFTQRIFTQKFYRMPIDFTQPEVQRYIEIYRRAHSRIMINRALQRSRPFALFIHQQLQKKGLPEELFLLPIIESEFLNTAKSHVGALGIWQIMENSMTHNMLISPWRDDRLNFWKSTESALARLEYNYNRLGDWKLSLSAYNAGLGRVTGLIRQHNESNYWTLARNSLLPKETREYIPKFYAIVYLASHSVQSNLRIHWDKSMDWSLVEIRKPLSLEEISALTSIPLELLKMGNEELKQGHTPRDSYQFFLKIPSFWREQVERTLSGRSSLSKNPLSPFFLEPSFFSLYQLKPTFENLLINMNLWQENHLS